MARVIGIDPGSRLTGYGVIEVGSKGLTYLASGCIRTGRGPFAERLAEIYQGVNELIGEHGPAAMAIEEVFLARNPDSALKRPEKGMWRRKAVFLGFGLKEHPARPKVSVARRLRLAPRDTRKGVGVP